MHGESQRDAAEDERAHRAETARSDEKEFGSVVLRCCGNHIARIPDLELGHNLQAGAELSTELLEQVRSGSAKLIEHLPVGSTHCCRPRGHAGLALWERRLDGMDENDPRRQTVCEISREAGGGTGA
jgi:hypothetical protein